MDQYSEVEAKFEADGLSVGRVQEFVDELSVVREGDTMRHELLGDHPKYRCYNYKEAIGIDTFFKVGEGTFRYRRDDVTKERAYPLGCEAMEILPSVLNCLTVKVRKSDRNLLNRKEVDLWIGDKVRPADMAAFVALLGGKESFSIQKQYWVWMLERGDVHICLALYDVCRPDGSEKRRFLEVEVEKNSRCTPAEGMAILKEWIAMVDHNFGVGKPVNTSLFELYGKGK